MMKGAWMHDVLFLPVTIFFGVAAVCLAGRAPLRVLRNKHGISADKQLWGSLAAGLFDATECPAHSRLEIILSAVAAKLKLRGAIVTLHSRSRCRVVASCGGDSLLLAGLERGSMLSRSSVFCSHLNVPGQSLAIDYASLSEWRRHPAFLDRGWESYIGLNCGLHEGEDLVVSFFDSSPRLQPFLKPEKQLVGQLAPWIVSMIGEGAGKTGEIAFESNSLLVPHGKDSSILE